MKKRIIVTIAFLLIALMAAGCAPKTKGYMTLNATGEDIATYSEGFKKYFDLDAVDAAGFTQGQFEVTDGSRYVVLAAQSSEALEGLAPVDAAFLIGLYDDGQAVQARIIYTTGAASENPTVPNPNWLSGISVAEETISFTPKETKYGTARAEQIAAMLYDALEDIEGE